MLYALFLVDYDTPDTTRSMNITQPVMNPGQGGRERRDVYSMNPSVHQIPSYTPGSPTPIHGSPIAGSPLLLGSNSPSNQQFLPATSPPNQVHLTATSPPNQVHLPSTSPPNGSVLFAIIFFP